MKFTKTDFPPNAHHGAGTGLVFNHDQGNKLGESITAALGADTVQEIADFTAPAALRGYLKSFYHSQADGWFDWQEDSFEAVDGGRVFQPTGHSGPGRFVFRDCTLKPEMFMPINPTPAETRAGLQACWDAAAANNASVFHRHDKTYIVDDTLRIPSNSILLGSATIKMSDSVGRKQTLCQSGALGDHRANIRVFDLTFDANSARHGIDSGGSGLSTDESCLVICNSSDVHLYRVKALDGWKHCIDVTAPSYNHTATTYDDEPSHNVWLHDCYATGAGDDNITTHFSYDLHIINCLSEHPSGKRIPVNSCCFEIDDGCRDVEIISCKAIGGVVGLQIKGHADAPAPMDVRVNGFTAINNLLPIDIRHIAHYGPYLVNDAPSTYYTESHSPNAYNLQLDDIKIIAPCLHSKYAASRSDTSAGDDPRWCFRLYSYRNVQIGKIHFSDGSDMPGDYEPAGTLTAGTVFLITAGARDVSISSPSVTGFSGVEYGIEFGVSFAGGGRVGHVTSIDGPDTVVYAWTQSQNVSVDSYSVKGSSSENAIKLSGYDETQVLTMSPDFSIPDTGSVITFGSGKTASVRPGSSSSTLVVKNSTGGQVANGDTWSGSTVVAVRDVVPKFIGSGDCDNYLAPRGNQPQTIYKNFSGFGSPTPFTASTVVEAPAQDLQIGSGAKHSYNVKLAADQYPYEVAWSGIYKQSGVDSDANFWHVIAVSEDGRAEPTPVVAVKPSLAVAPMQDGVSQLGSYSYRWLEVRAVNGVLTTSDARKKVCCDFSPPELRVAKALSCLGRKYQWKHGKDKRFRVGVLAQDVIAAFESNGLDFREYSVVEHEHEEFAVNYDELAQWQLIGQRYTF